MRLDKKGCNVFCCSRNVQRMYPDIFSPLSVNHFIRKPIDNEDLLKRINEVIIVVTTVSISSQ